MEFNKQDIDKVDKFVLKVGVQLALDKFIKAHDTSFVNIKRIDDEASWDRFEKICLAIAYIKQNYVC